MPSGSNGAFGYRDNVLHVEEVELARIAERTGTPVYVYSSRWILDRYGAYDRAFGSLPHTVCYAVKANSNLSILALLARAGAGFDIVSGGELFRVLKAGGDPRKVVFSGVGKTADEVLYALESGIHSFNVESEAELALIDSLAARRRVKASVAVRVNPDVDTVTHPYISTGLRQHKFGVDIADVEGVYERARRLANLSLDGVSCHIGSQLLDTGPMIESLDKMIALAGRLRAAGIPLRNLDVGGGLGVAYQPSENSPDIEGFITAVRDKVAAAGLHVMVEPGRSIVGESGALITRVLYRKHTEQKEFVVVDAGMNDLIRPALYRSHHEIIPLRRTERPMIRADVVGPVCETGDFLARDRELAGVLPGDLLAVLTAGAYGFVLSSNYNSRPRPAEVLVTGDQFQVVRMRESLADLVRGE